MDIFFPIGIKILIFLCLRDAPLMLSRIELMMQEDMMSDLYPSISYKIVSYKDRRAENDASVFSFL